MITKNTVRIATRQSPLALWQANFIKGKLEEYYPQLSVELITMVTKGDIILDSPLAKIGGKGLFVKELEQAIIDGKADLAVHSMKDVPIDFPTGLGLVTICKRESPYDAFVSNRYQSIDELPLNAVVGTCSLRRASQLKASRPDIVIKDLRGNVGTRLAKLDKGDFDAIILATAGLKRLGLEHRITQILPETRSLPAVGQGAVGIECRLDDSELIDLLAPLNDSDTADCVLCERAMNTTLEGGCQVPIAGFAVLDNDQLWLRALVAEPDGTKIIFAEIRGQRSNAKQLGQVLAKELLDKGAKAILEKLYSK